MAKKKPAKPEASELVRETAEDVYNMIREAPGLTEPQKRGIAVWVISPPGTCMVEVAKAIGVSRDTFYAWRGDAVFMETYERALRAVNVPIIQDSIATMSKAVKEDWRAAAQYLKLEQTRHGSSLTLSGEVSVIRGDPDEHLSRLTDADASERAARDAKLARDDEERRRAAERVAEASGDAQ